MNMVGKEGPSVNQRSGVLVLSESAGAHEELGTHGLSINPFDVEITAQAIHRALEMSPSERAQRSQAINQIVTPNDVARWIRHQLEDIRSLTPPLRRRSNGLEAPPNGSRNRPPAGYVRAAGRSGGGPAGPRRPEPARVTLHAPPGPMPLGRGFR